MTEASQLLEDFYRCKINKNIIETHIRFFDLSVRTRFFCNNNVTKCSDPEFHREKCLESRQRLVKTVRIRLHQVAHLVVSLNLKIIVLHRDPRGVMNSRWKKGTIGWCRK